MLDSDGRCVVVTSHVLDEVERFGSDVLVMAKGRLAAAGDFREIRALMDDRPRRVVVRTSEPRLLGADLLHAGVVVGVRGEGDDALLLDTEDARGLGRALAPLARARGARSRVPAPRPCAGRTRQPRSAEADRAADPDRRGDLAAEHQ